MNINETTLRATRQLGIFILAGCVIPFATTGCRTTEQIVEASLADCGEAYNKGRDKIQDSFDEALDCCKELLPANPAGYADCVQKVEDARQTANDSLDAAHQACVDANTSLLTSHVEAITDVVKDAVKTACSVIDVIGVTKNAAGDQAANILDNSDGVDSIQLSLRGIVSQANIGGSADVFEGQPGMPSIVSRRIQVQLGGTISSMFGDGTYTTGISATMTATLPGNRHGSGTIQHLDLKLAGVGEYELARGFQSTLKPTGAGQYLIQAVFKPSSDTQNEQATFGFYAEIPFSMDRGRAKAGWGNTYVPVNTALPVAPNAIADWNRDFVVDMYDYAAFLADFAEGVIDLNGDGESNDADFAVFEDRFNNSRDN